MDTIILSDQPKPHPFLLSSVLEILFPLLDYKTLKTSRLVCSTWCKVSLKRFHEKSKLELKFEPKTRCSEISSHSPLDFISIFKVEKQNRKYPLYSALKISARDLKDLQKFKWLKQSVTRNAIKTLEMTDLEFPEQITFIWIKEILNEWCPQLENLSIDFPLITYTIFLEQFGLRMDDLKEIFALPLTKLNKLELRPVFFKNKESTSPPEYVKPLLSSITDLKILTMPMCLMEFISNPNVWPSHSSLLELNLQYEMINAKSLEILSEVKFPKLKRLTLSDFSGDFSNSELFVRAVTHVISNHCDTLEQISLKRVEEDNQTGTRNAKLKHFTQHFCELKRRRFTMLSRPQINFNNALENLKVFENEDLNRWSLSSLDILQEMPNLEKLVLKSSDLTPDPAMSDFIGDQLSLLENPHLKLEELRFEVAFGCATAKVPQRITRCFPNLKILHLRLTEVTEGFLTKVLEVLANFTKLEVLKITLSCFHMFESDCFYTSLALTLPKFPKLREFKFAYEWKRVIWNILPEKRKKSSYRINLLVKSNQNLIFLHQHLLRAPALTYLSFEGFQVERVKYWDMVASLSSELVCLKFKDCQIGECAAPAKYIPFCRSISSSYEQSCDVTWGKFSNFITTPPKDVLQWS